MCFIPLKWLKITLNDVDNLPWFPWIPSPLIQQFLGRICSKTTMDLTEIHKDTLCTNYLIEAPTLIRPSCQMRCLDRVVGWAGWVIIQTWSLRMENIKVINDSSHGKMPPCQWGTQLLRRGAQPGDQCRTMKETESRKSTLCYLIRRLYQETNIVSVRPPFHRSDVPSWLTLSFSMPLFFSTRNTICRKDSQHKTPLGEGPFPWRCSWGWGMFTWGLDNALEENVPARARG